MELQHRVSFFHSLYIITIFISDLPVIFSELLVQTEQNESGVLYRNKPAVRFILLYFLSDVSPPSMISLDPAKPLSMWAGINYSHLGRPKHIHYLLQHNHTLSLLHTHTHMHKHIYELQESIIVQTRSPCGASGLLLVKSRLQRVHPQTHTQVRKQEESEQKSEKSTWKE